MATGSNITVQKIKITFNRDATTPEELLTVSQEYCYRGNYNEFNLFTSDLKYLDFLELCTQPKTDEEKDNILSDFKNKLKSVLAKHNFCEFDVLCLYALHYIYQNNNANLSAVSRALYAWYKLDDLVSHGCENRNSVIYHNNETFLSELRQFTNLYSHSDGDKVIIFAWYESIMSGNSSLARFLLKYGLIEFECSVNSVQLLSMILKKFKENPQVTKYIELEELAHLMKQSKFSFRRSVLTFYTIVLVAELQMFEWIFAESGEKRFEKLKSMCIPKLKCLDLLVSATTETKITVKDIDYFIAHIVNPFINSDFSMCGLLETFRKTSCEVNENYNTRSLKDLARCKIRACLQSRVMLPEQVMKLEIPEPLKQFLLFHCEDMWDLLEKSHLHVKFINNL